MAEHGREHEASAHRRAPPALHVSADQRAPRRFQPLASVRGRQSSESADRSGVRARQGIRRAECDGVDRHRYRPHEPQEVRPGSVSAHGSTVLCPRTSRDEDGHRLAELPLRRRVGQPQPRPSPLPQRVGLPERGHAAVRNRQTGIGFRAALPAEPVWRVAPGRHQDVEPSDGQRGRALRDGDDTARAGRQGVEPPQHHGSGGDRR